MSKLSGPTVHAVALASETKRKSVSIVNIISSPGAYKKCLVSLRIWIVVRWTLLDLSLCKLIFNYLPQSSL